MCLSRGPSSQRRWVRPQPMAPFLALHMCSLGAVGSALEHNDTVSPMSAGRLMLRSRASLGTHGKRQCLPKRVTKSLCGCSMARGERRSFGEVLTSKDLVEHTGLHNWVSREPRLTTVTPRKLQILCTHSFSSKASRAACAVSPLQQSRTEQSAFCTCDLCWGGDKPNCRAGENAESVWKRKLGEGQRAPKVRGGPWRS